MTAILSQMSSYISVSTNGRAIAVDDEFGGEYFLYKITLRFSDRVYFTPKLKPGLLTRASRLSLIFITYLMVKIIILRRKFVVIL